MKHLLKKINRGVILGILIICALAGSYIVQAEKAKPEIPEIEALAVEFGKIYKYGKIRLPEYRDFVVYPEPVILEHKEKLRARLQEIYAENAYEIDNWLEIFFAQGILENSVEYTSKYTVTYKDYKALKIRGDEATVIFRHKLKFKMRKRDDTYEKGYFEHENYTYMVTTAALTKIDGKWRANNLSATSTYMW